MPDWNPNVTRSHLHESLATVSGTAIAPVQNGVDIPDDKVRYIWKIKGRNLAGAARVLIVFASNVGLVPLREILRLSVPALGNIDYPLQASPDAPIIRVAPNTGVAPTQENQIYLGDDGAGGQLVDLTVEYVDKRN